VLSVFEDLLVADQGGLGGLRRKVSRGRVERRRYAGRVNTEETVLTPEVSGAQRRATVLDNKGGLGLRAVVGFKGRIRIIQSGSQGMQWEGA
jgi:hypothetical protein